MEWYEVPVSTLVETPSQAMVVECPQCGANPGEPCSGIPVRESPPTGNVPHIPRAQLGRWRAADARALTRYMDDARPWEFA